MKEWEDAVTVLQADMVSLSLEYVDNKADRMYMDGSYEPEANYVNVFYQIGQNMNEIS